MMVEMLVQTLIQAMYPGGMAEFDRKYTTFITRDNKLILAPLEAGDEVGDEFKERLEKALINLQVEVVYASRTNFSDFEDMQEAQEVFKKEMTDESLKAFDGRININVNQALMDIIVPDMKMNSFDGEKLRDNLLSLTGVCNIRIEYKDETFFQVESKDKTSLEFFKVTNVPSSSLVTGRPDRDIVINNDDTMNLKIALGQAQDVDEFLRMI